MSFKTGHKKKYVSGKAQWVLEPLELHHVGLQAWLKGPGFGRGDQWMSSGRQEQKPREMTSPQEQSSRLVLSEAVGVWCQPLWSQLSSLHSQCAKALPCSLTHLIPELWASRAGQDLLNPLGQKKRQKPSLQISMTWPGHSLKPLAMSAVLWQHFPKYKDATC